MTSEGTDARGTAPGADPIALWLVPVPEIGGVARHVLDAAATGLPGHRLVVLCPEGPLAERLRALGTPVVAGDFGTGAGFAASARELRRTIRALRPAVVHAHLAFADVVAAAVVAPMKARGHAPVLATTEHGIAPDDSTYQTSAVRARVMNGLHAARLRATELAIAVCDSTKRVMESKWGASRVRVVRNGIDAAEIARRVEAVRVPRSGGRRFLSLARLAPEKNLPTLLEAFALLREQEPDATLEVAGTGPLEAELKALAARLGLGEAVSFPGFVDPFEAMGRSDVVVQLSEWENYSYTLLDARAAGLAVVATDVGGNAEILARAGVIPPNASPEKVALAMHDADVAGDAPDITTPEEMTAALAAAYSEVSGILPRRKHA